MQLVLLGLVAVLYKLCYANGYNWNSILHLQLTDV